MGFEGLKYDFPKMPEEMRTMIENEVNRQVKIEQPKFTKNKRTAGKVLAASAAVVVLLGTTTFAGVSIYRMQRQQVAEHGVNVKISEHADQASSAGAANVKPEDIPNVKMKVGYLPDGMVQTEEGKYSYEDALNKGGVSICFYRMDTGDGQFEMLHGDVLSSEEITLGGNEGVYLEYPHLYEDEITFNQKIYVAYTDVHYVMEMYAASDVKKEEAIKIAENIKLVPVKDSGIAMSADTADGQSLIRAWNWSDYLADKTEQDKQDAAAGEALASSEGRTVSKEEMRNTHAVGESFSVENKETGEKKGLMAKVSSVQVSDDLSLLDPAYVDEDLKKETDGSGRLKPATIQYIKEGGMQSVSEVVKSREAAQKLVYVTVEYTNTGSSELKDVLFFSSLERISEEDGQMQVSSGWNYEEPSATDEWTHAANRGLSNYSEMLYYDVHGGERNNNYIACIKPGETAVVHMAWIATEEELGRLYLNLDTYGGSGVFTDTALDLGYVDIRQK